MQVSGGMFDQEIATDLLASGLTLTQMNDRFRCTGPQHGRPLHPLLSCP
jgi:hypothetical protein